MRGCEPTGRWTYSTSLASYSSLISWGRIGRLIDLELGEWEHQNWTRARLLPLYCRRAGAYIKRTSSECEAERLVPGRLLSLDEFMCISCGSCSWL